MTESRLLILWDVDGTLVSGAAQAHGRALEIATAEAIGREVPTVQSIDPGGRTDREIIRVLAGEAGVDAEEFAPLADRVITKAVEIYGATVEPDLTHCVLPSVSELVSGLSPRDDLVMGLVTGNIDRVAALKLGAAGISRHFDFEAGAYGSDHEDRAVLPGIARARATRGRAAWPRERTVIIGDTPRDIACARADRVGVIAVATGPHQASALTEADAVANSAADLLALIEPLV
ncbi:MAG: haloacid dehalogenase-like hydrolase [Solirubrobacterales bacterium]|nr:haloacid dehalogenase-like hydrolase [Solirubrobacterales bacterium]